jgi:hypothetical protein
MNRVDQLRIYAHHVWALFRAGSGAPVHNADPNEPGNVAGWFEAHIKTLIDEGRRQLDRQNDDLERVRVRAQVTLIVGLALEGTAGSLHATVSSAGILVLSSMWILGLALIAWAILGAAATAVVRADMDIIHATVLSRYTGDIDRLLAADYAAIAPAGEKQVAGRLTNLRLAVAFLLAGAAITLVVWIWADAAQQPQHRSIPQPVQQHQWPTHCIGRIPGGATMRLGRGPC